MAFPPLVMMPKAWLFLLPLAPTVIAQTFPDYPLANTWSGLSTSCLAALNTTVQCSNLLPVSAQK